MHFFNECPPLMLISFGWMIKRKPEVVLRRTTLLVADFAE